MATAASRCWTSISGRRARPRRTTPAARESRHPARRSRNQVNQPRKDTRYTAAAPQSAAPSFVVLNVFRGCLRAIFGRREEMDADQYTAAPTAVDTGSPAELNLPLSF